MLQQIEQAYGRSCRRGSACTSAKAQLLISDGDLPSFNKRRPRHYARSELKEKVLTAVSYLSDPTLQARKQKGSPGNGVLQKIGKDPGPGAKYTEAEWICNVCCLPHDDSPSLMQSKGYQSYSLTPAAAKLERDAMNGRVEEKVSILLRFRAQAIADFDQEVCDFLTYNCDGKCQKRNQSKFFVTPEQPSASGCLWCPVCTGSADDVSDYSSKWDTYCANAEKRRSASEQAECAGAGSVGDNALAPPSLEK